MADSALFKLNDLTNSLEHMEEDDPDASSTLPRWVFLEYAQMLNLAGPSSTVIFAHLSKSSCDALNDALHESGRGEQHAKFEVHEKGVMELMSERKMDLKAVCLLDPKAHQELAPEDGVEGEFRWFLFGVIRSMVTTRNKQYLTLYICRVFSVFHSTCFLHFAALLSFSRRRPTARSNRGATATWFSQ